MAEANRAACRAAPPVMLTSRVHRSCALGGGVPKVSTQLCFSVPPLACSRWAHTIAVASVFLGPHVEHRKQWGDPAGCVTRRVTSIGQGYQRLTQAT
jgi:hypothetical protein